MMVLLFCNKCSVGVFAIALFNFKNIQILMNVTRMA